MKLLKLDDLDLFVTISTSGQIRIWDVVCILKEVDGFNQNEDLADNIKPVYEINTNERLISFDVRVENK